MMGRAYFIVRAEVPDSSDRAAFDRWYAEEHLPDAVARFRARAGWRGWSQTDPAIHYAFYEFDDVERMQAALGSGALQELIADFDRAWGTRVKRTRDMVEVAGAIPG